MKIQFDINPRLSDSMILTVSRHAVNTGNVIAMSTWTTGLRRGLRAAAHAVKGIVRAFARINADPGINSISAYLRKSAAHGLLPAVKRLVVVLRISCRSRFKYQKSPQFTRLVAL
ncbi:MAG: hypothetical protein LAP21_22515 [Acidobacteriia bacterium]|nr:hypothetical protein [Terriglobia bacterium]